MPNLIGPLSSGVAAGSPGSATANQTCTAVVNGKLLGIYVQYLDSPPATTDVTISTLGTSPAAPALTLLTLTDQATSKWVFPRALAQSEAGANLTGWYVELPICDLIKVTIAQANANDSVNVWMLVE